MKFFALLFVLLVSVAIVPAQNEQAPIVEKEITYKNWTYKGVRDDRNLDLREFASGKKLVMVVYFAPWCGNWKHDAPMLQRLYEKYKPAGLEIVAVGEYDPVDSMRKNIETFKLTFPMVYESKDRADKQKTLHYEYRKATGDTRGWGSPWYIFVEPTAIEKKGDVLLKKANVINGEMIEAEGEKFIRQKLGLPVETKTTTAKNGEVEVCDPATSKTELKKP